MSTPQSIPHLTPRSRIRPGTLLTALGVLFAIAVSIVILALTNANHTTIATPATPAQAAADSTPHVRYLGSEQVHAALNPVGGGGTTSTAGVGTPAHYDCLGAARSCLR
ncbi:MAG TPA: hypothetical protein VMF57_21895 [Solirubrobacteraceae bacterium]|nr:hypothetical protein [Solirubrobacteraceae bacterium]